MWAPPPASQWRQKQTKLSLLSRGSLYPLKAETDASLCASRKPGPAASPSLASAFPNNRVTAQRWESVLEASAKKMSGEIFSPLESLDALEASNVHPLVCFLCHGQYEHPCLLDCYHNFCASCLRGRAVDGRLPCPLCGHPSVVKGANGLPPVDRLLQFLVDGSSDGEEAVRCANCDLECPAQDAETTYFCNTCGQPLCAHCREETHKAKMFSCHDIVALGKRTKDAQKKCSLHGEPFIMFSTDKKSMLCIRCFGDMQGESRAHCIDIETAYVQGCEKLDQTVLAVKALQTSTREAIALLQTMVEEVRQSVADEESAIHTLFSSMQEKLTERKALLLKAVRSQYEEKDKAFKDQLSHLASLLPTLQVHLVTCSAFLSSANKAEFLDLGYELMERLQGIVTQPHHLQPTQSSKITSDHRAEFARCLEPLLLLGARRAPATGAAATMLSGCSTTKTLKSSGCPSPGGKMCGSPVHKPTLHRSISTKLLLAEGGDTRFIEHCHLYEETYRILQSEIQNLKDQVQELHRDLTKHHSLIKAEIMSDILQKSLQVDGHIASQYASVEMMRAVFEEKWEETYQRVANEQEIYEAQLYDLFQLRQENNYLTNITKQITPYVRSIAKVKERLEPRFQEPIDEQSENLQKIYEDTVVMDENQTRNEPKNSSEEKKEDAGVQQRGQPNSEQTIRTPEK
ncbi:RING finger protein 207 isoform X2 [Monodelphis domestica]|uniref:RING finger protein 207 isoform X2 n=1 Tax=Monodelphis domestica TaxID=13616 RepID=UPI0024E1AB67|nr:RING finger protein 207 isoform X2 [Monodelphis domestica]